MKNVVILLNMGGPNNINEVGIFLKNMFNDKYILPIKNEILRMLVAKFIATIRLKEASKTYEKIGGKSPINLHTKKLCKKLNSIQNELIFDYAMNYTPPFADEIIQKYQNCKNLILFPLYPHHSKTTIGSSLDSALKACLKYNIENIKIIKPFWDDKEYNKILLKNIKNHTKDMQNSHLIFSAHSLPVSVIKKGDLYEKHINSHIELLKKELNFKQIHLAYQSRLGPIKWLGPNISEVLDTLKNESVVIYPLSFCIDCSESDFELAIMYKEYAKNAGILDYSVIKAPNSSDDFAEFIINKSKEIL